MLSLLKSWNPLVNVALFPGAYVSSSYSIDSLLQCDEEGNTKVIFIPINPDSLSSVCFNVPKHIPAILVRNSAQTANIFVIYFHGNGCDVGNVLQCAYYETQEFNAHYLVVEYPRYGISLGLPSEESVNRIAKSIFHYVDNLLGVPHTKIVVMGRSIGTGPAAYLASYMEKNNRSPLALILHSPYSSIRNAGAELVGPISFGVLNRWENWKYVCHVGGNHNGNGDSNSISNSNSNSSNGSGGGYNCSTDGFPVVTCPVMFLHADNDVIIDCSHSRKMHQQRLQNGFISSLYIQKSDQKLIKGHNYYDYDNDYLYPIKKFLQKVRAFPESPASSSSIKLPDTILSLGSVIPSTYNSNNPQAMNKVKALTNAMVALQWICCPLTLFTECACACSYTLCCINAEMFLFPESHTISTFDYNDGSARPVGCMDNFFVKALVSIAKNQSFQFNFENEDSLKEKSERETKTNAIVMQSSQIPYETVELETDNPLHSPVANSINVKPKSIADGPKSYPNEIIIDEFVEIVRARRRKGKRVFDSVCSVNKEQINPLVSNEMNQLGLESDSSNSDSDNDNNSGSRYDSDDDSVYHDQVLGGSLGTDNHHSRSKSNNDNSRNSSTGEGVYNRLELQRVKLDYIPG